VKSSVSIELFDERDKVNFYTIRFHGEETETDKFLDKFPENCEYDEDIDIIIKWINIIAERGALKRHFRYEGKLRDQVLAVPIETSNLRLYVIRVSESIIILGNGGAKTTRKYNDDAFLNSCVELLQEVDGYLRYRIRQGTVAVYQKQLLGDLTFHLKNKSDEE